MGSNGILIDFNGVAVRIDLYAKLGDDLSVNPDPPCFYIHFSLAPGTYARTGKKFLQSHFGHGCPANIAKIIKFKSLDFSNDSKQVLK
jgi:hypothetical protein